MDLYTLCEVLEIIGIPRSPAMDLIAASIVTRARGNHGESPCATTTSIGGEQSQNPSCHDIAHRCSRAL